MDLDLAPQAFAQVLRAIVQIDLLQGADAPRALPWEYRCAQLFGGVEAGRALKFTQGLQRALARAALEQWTPAQLEAHLLGGGLEASKASAAGAFWGKEREGVLAAVQARAFVPCPQLRGAPSFAVATPTASSDGVVGGEPLAVLRFETSAGSLTVEASRGVLAAAVVSLNQARKSLGSS